MLKRSLGLYPNPLWNTLPLFNQLVCSNSGNMAAGKGYDDVPPGLEYPRGGRSEMDLERQSRGYDMTSLQTVPRRIAGMLAFSCLKRKLFPTV